MTGVKTALWIWAMRDVMRKPGEALLLGLVLATFTFVLGLGLLLAQAVSVTGVAILDHDQRVEEVARMLAGKKVTTTSLSHAQELLAGAGKPA